MTDFIEGKIKVENGEGVFSNGTIALPKREFSSEAKKVFDAGRALWLYYHQTIGANKYTEFYGNYNINASLYDIRKTFQGEKNGRMNSKSKDNYYNELMSTLREALRILGDMKITPKVYEYGFLLVTDVD